MSERIELDPLELCGRHLYYGIPVPATHYDPHSPPGLSKLCEECHAFLYQKDDSTRGCVGPIDPLDQPTIGKEA